MLSDFEVVCASGVIFALQGVTIQLQVRAAVMVNQEIVQSVRYVQNRGV